MIVKKSITISGVEVSVLFSFYTYRLLGDFWQKETIQQVMDHVVKATTGVGEESLSFEAMTVFSDIVQVLDESKQLTEREIQDHLFAHPEDISTIVEAFVDSLSAAGSGEQKKKSRKQVKN